MFYFLNYDRLAKYAFAQVRKGYFALGLSTTNVLRSLGQHTESAIQKFTKKF